MTAHLHPMPHRPALAILRGRRWPNVPAKLGAAALLAAGLTVVSGGVSEARTLRCGDVITSDTTLSSDLVNCTSKGLVVGADGITLDLNGHVISGDGAPVPSCPADQLCDVGVDNNSGHSHVTITGGAIRGFDIGVHVLGGADDRIYDMAISDTASLGILVGHSTRTVIEHNVIHDPGVAAVVVDFSADPLASFNVASGTTGYAMVFLEDTNGRFMHNSLTSDEHGFAVSGTKNTIQNNVVTNSSGSIDVFDGAVATRVESNHLSNVGDGVIVGVASGTLVRHNVVKGTGGDDGGGFGIILDGSVDSVVDHNLVNATGFGPGIYVARLDAPTPPKGNRVTRNVTASKNADGILVDPDAVDTLLWRNVAVGSGDDGIDVQAQATTVTRNIASRNQDLGISAVPGVTDGGGNRAAGNGNPAQCTNIVCK
jgi:Periplasmic copper-binding protein (NosD)